MKKKVLSVLLALTLVVSATACGSKSSDNKGTEAGTEAAKTETDGDTFLIGAIGPLTGAAASYGTSVKQGAEIAINEINEKGGVKVGDKTYKLAMQFEDDEATEDKAIAAYNTVMDAGANAILGCVTSGACMAITDQTKADGILQITPSGSAEGCIENDNAFRICFSDPEQGVAMADFAVDTLGYKNIAVLYNTADDYSKGLQEAFEKEVATKGGKIVASEAFNTGDVDFNSQLTKIKAANPDAIYVPAYYQDVTYITKQAAEAGIKTPFIGSDGWDGVLGTVTDKATVENAIFTSPFCAAVADENVVNFVKAYEAAYKATPDQFAADAYDTVYTIAAAMEKAGSIESADMIAAMTEITVKGLTGDAITFNANGAPNKEVRFVQIVNGAYQYYTK